VPPPLCDTCPQSGVRADTTVSCQTGAWPVRGNFSDKDRVVNPDYTVKGEKAKAAAWLRGISAAGGRAMTRWWARNQKQLA
jgi:hypothetical protein